MSGGSLALGSGIWAMQFIGMIAWRLPIVLGDAVVPTLLSWVAAVGVSGVALGIATRETLGMRGLALGAVVMGAGICTGYSSLSDLRRLPARQLKIDRSFIDDLEDSSDARAVVEVVIRLAHALGLSVVAEGVETAAQRTIPGDLGCDESQGYFFARPIPAERLLAWAIGHRPDGSAQFSPSMLHDAL